MSYILLRNVCVDYPIYQGASRSLKKMVLAATTHGNLARDAYDRINVRALLDITLDIREGDRVGLVGQNGAGKTTLLKVLAGVFEPSNGRVFADGRISTLLDVAIGINPNSTGYENIILRGMYMGIHPRKMRTFFDDVASFTELGEYLDMPVRTYSSGMMVRLAFAIATCIHPEILLMDEWIGAGDAKFIQKAEARLASFVQSSRILVLASHSMQLLKKWCNRGVLLHQGKIVATGEIDEVIAKYGELLK